MDWLATSASQRQRTAITKSQAENRAYFLRVHSKVEEQMQLGDELEMKVEIHSKKQVATFIRGKKETYIPLFPKDGQRYNRKRITT